MKSTFIKIGAAVLFFACVMLGCKTTKTNAEAEQISEPSVDELMDRLDEAMKDIPAQYKRTGTFQTTPYNNGAAIIYYNGADSTVVIPESVNGTPVTGIKPGVFAGNTALKEIVVDENNALYSSINGVLFDKAGTTLICYPAGKTGSSYAIPQSVATVEEQAFAGTIEIGTVTVPASTTLIKDGAFSGCTNLEAIEVNAGNTSYSSTNGILYNKNATALFVYPAGKTDSSYAIPNTVLSIGNKAFADCKYIGSINIPKSVYDIGPNAFYGASKLNSIVVDENNNMYSSKDGVLFDKNAALLMCYPAGKTGSYNVPQGVKTIRGGAFYGSAQLNAVNISSDVVTIGSGAFAGCTQLQSINIPSRIQSIGAWAFYKCTNLTEILIPSGVTRIENGAFYGCTNLKRISITGDIDSIGSWAFAACVALNDISLSEGIKSIGKWAFAGCKSLSTLVLPSTITSIDEWTFYDCSALSSLVIPADVTNIKKQAFRGCSKLVDINIPDSVNTIEEKAFLGCINLNATLRDQIVKRFGLSVF